MKISKKQLKQLIKEELEATNLQEIFGLFGKGEDEKEFQREKGQQKVQSFSVDNYDTKEFRIRFSLAGQTSFGAQFKVTKNMVQDHPELAPFLNKSINLSGRLLPRTKEQLLKLGFVDKSDKTKAGADFDPSGPPRDIEDEA